MIHSDECRARERAALLGLKSRVAAEKTRFPLNPEARLLVPQRTRQPPLFGISMRGLLKEACNKLDMPAPLFGGLRATSYDGRDIHRYLVSLVLPGSSNELVVAGRIAADPNESLEDAARAGL
ncbi:hypothetical protein PIB30_098085, partial [Stylosanthes scabra]|nr:hypothetical protein [Stylosanthes scabra]